MIDSTGEEGKGGEGIGGQEEAIKEHHDSDGNGGNSNESIPRGEYSEFYEQYLYSMLPAVYQEYDTKENNVLQEFLKVIASQAAAIRQDIDSLLNNFFINSCDEWVIPYIADLIAAKVVPNSSLNSRLDVQNTIRWRKAKGTQTGLVDLIRNTINGNAKVKEAFRYCSSFQHLSFGATDIVVNKPRNFVNLHDQDALSNIDTENDIMPHTVDVREPKQTTGWYNIKNILIFMPQLNVYHIRQVQVEKEEDRLGYYFSNIVRKKQQQQQSPSSLSFSSSSNNFPLYDLDEGVRIRGATFAQNPYKYFGKKTGMSVKIANMLAACANPPTFSPVAPNDNLQEDRITIRAETNESNYDNQRRGDYDSSSSKTNPDFVSLHDVEGIRILESRSFSGPDKRFIIRLYCYSEEQGAVEVANYDTSKMSYHPVLPGSELRKVAFGTILISLELDSRLRLSEFPETVIAIRDSREKILVKDSLRSKYRNALYVYLPSILLNYDEKKYFLVDRDGSTYEVKMINGRYDIHDPKLGRIAASSQIYPPRQLTYSLEPLHNFAQLNRFNGIKAVDAKKYGKESFQIVAVAINRDKGQAWKIGTLEAKAGSLKYINEKEVWIQWRIILGNSDDPQLKGYPRRIYKEHFLPACHFKAKRLALDKNFEELPDKKIGEIVKKEILPDYARNEKVLTVSIDQKKKAYNASNNNNNDDDDDNTDEYEVKIIIRPEHHEQFEYVVSEIKNSIEKKPEFVNDGKLMLRISRTTKGSSRGEFPLSEIILTSSSSRSVLVYLPELKFDKKNQEKNLYVANDGSTSNEEDLSKQAQARMSAGQIIPIANKYPLQQRIPVYLNMADWQSVSTRYRSLWRISNRPRAW